MKVRVSFRGVPALAALLAGAPGAALAHHDELGAHLIETAPAALPMLALAALALRRAASPCRRRGDEA